MFWMFELMFMMFILLFSDTQRLKNELELEQIMRQYDNFENRTDSENPTPYVIPEIKPRYDTKKKVDK